MLAIAVALIVQDDLAADVRRWLEEPAARRELAERIARRPIPAIERAIRAAGAFEKRESGVANFRAPNAFDPSVAVECLLWVPEHDPAKRHPLLLTLHGQRGDAESQLRPWLADAKKEPGLFVLAPTARRGGWGHSRLGYGNVLGPLRDALARWPIDPDRVALDGASMGGNGSFQFATHHPDLLAAVAPRIGGPEFVGDREDRTKVTPRFLENLRNVPVYWIVGDRDAQCPIEWVRVAKGRMEELKLDLTYRELEGGHEWFPEENPRVLEWLRGRQRQTYPQVVHWITTERICNCAYGVEITRFAKEADERLKRRYQGLEGDVIEERTHFLNPVEIRAEFDREANAVRVTARHVDEFRLWLSDAQLDLDREIAVVVNGGTKAKKKIARSASVLLESALRDRSMLFSATLDVKAK